MATNFSGQIGEIGLFTLRPIRRFGIGNRLHYRTADFKGVIYDDLVKFGPVTQGNSKVSKDERRRLTPLVNQQFGYVRFTAKPCRDQY